MFGLQCIFAVRYTFVEHTVQVFEVYSHLRSQTIRPLDVSQALLETMSHSMHF